MTTTAKHNFSLFSLDDSNDFLYMQVVREEQMTYNSHESVKRKRLSTIELGPPELDRKSSTGVSFISDRKQAVLDDPNDLYTYDSTVNKAENHFPEDGSDSESGLDTEFLDIVDDNLVEENSSLGVSKRTRYRSLDDFRVLRAEFLQQFTRMLCPRANIKLCTACQEIGSTIICLDCFHFCNRCQNCILKEHAHHPLHRLRYFEGCTWQQTLLRNLGLKVYLGHDSNVCPSAGSLTDLKTITVIDIKGIQDVSVFFCACKKLVGVDAMECLQLIQHGWYPATTEHPRTVATFSTLDIFEALSGEGKMSGYHFYKSLVRLRDGSGCENVPKRYEEFMQMTRKYQHLKMLQQAGKICNFDECLYVGDGELALDCPACPHPGKNIPDDWDKKVDAWIYTLFIMIDANFQLKSKKKRSTGDKDLGGGNSYFVRDEPYKSYLKSAVEEKEIKYCDSGLRAVDHASLKGGKGYEASGVVGVQCRHMLIRKNGVGDLQKGEKYANVDYVVLSSIKNLNLKRLTMSYDISCQYSRNFSKRMLRLDQDLQLDLSKISLEFVIPQFHIASHGKSCRTAYNLRFREHVGWTDGENIERGWAAFNPLLMVSKEMSSGVRWDYLNWHIGDWNYQRILSFYYLFPTKLKEAVEESVKHTAAMTEFHKAFPKGMIKEIEDSIKQWDGDRLNSPNPYAEHDYGNALCTTHQSLLQAEANEESSGILHLESMSATHWLVVGLELEDSQRQAKKRFKSSNKDTATRSGTSGMEGNMSTIRKIRTWKDQQLLYMPGLPQYE